MEMLRRAAVAAAITLLAAADLRADFLLAGQRIRFRDDGTPQFTWRQSRGTATATRAGLTRWAATPQGRKLIARFDTKEFEIVVTEDGAEAGFGRAPQPPLATLLAANRSAVRKSYELLLNPRFDVPERFRVLPGEPATPGQMMAAAWAAEMLHIYFYSIGVSLPHHARDDFRQAWMEVAAQLGWPTMQHRDEPAPRAGR